MSPDVYAIIDLVATALTQEPLSYYDACPSVLKGMFQQRICRSLGLAARAIDSTAPPGGATKKLVSDSGNVEMSLL